MSDKAYIFGSGPFGIALRTLPGKMVSHWLFQGLAYMDPTERAFKLGLDGLLALAIAAALLGVRLPAGLVAVVAILGAHSLNFLLNGQLRVVLKWHGIGGVPKAAMEAELDRIAHRLSANGAVLHAYAYGSLSRGELHHGSDLDIRVVRREGVRAGLQACIGVLLERTRSLLSGVPVDIYVLDSTSRLEDMRADEHPIDLLAPYRRAPIGSPRVAFLRACRAETRVSSTDIEVVPELMALGWQPLLVAVGPWGMSQVADLAAPSAVVWAPRIPLVGAAIANLLAVIPVVRFRPDVILVNPGLAVAGALCALLLRRAAIVADVRSVPVNPPGSLAARVGDLEFRLAMHLPRLSAVTAITAGTASLLRARYGLAPAVPITIWGSGANVALFNPEVRGVPREAFAPPNRILICYHGHLSLARGLGTLIDALAVARRSEPRLHLILLGGGKDLSALRERVLRAGLEEYVTFLAPVPIADVPGYLAACDGAVIPLPDEVIWRVSSPLKLYEDLAMGLPVLATDIEPHRGFGDLITLCSPDILGIAAGLLKLAGDAIAHERSPRRADLQSLSWAFPARHLSEGLERSIGI